MTLLIVCFILSKLSKIILRRNAVHLACVASGFVYPLERSASLLSLFLFPKKTARYWATVLFVLFVLPLSHVFFLGVLNGLSDDFLHREGLSTNLSSF